METATGQSESPKDPASENAETVTVVEVDAPQDVEKSLYDAEEFLTNFAGLREENEHLKNANQELHLQLEKARQDLQQLAIDKQALETQLVQEREQHREEVWKVRSEFQKLQEERLQWKEKYLNIYMKSNSEDASYSKSKKRKQSGTNSSLENDNSDFYSNLSSTLGLEEEDQQPDEVVLTLMSENSKAYKISIRECKYCGVGFCSTYALSEHYKSCANKPQETRDTDSNTVDCTECGVKFPTHADLVQHNQYHQGTHKYLCRICNRSYQSNPGRLKHEQLEHGSQPLLHCDACGRQFKRKDRLKDHMATKHSLDTPHRCPYCSASFKLRDYLRKHVNQSHPGQILGASGYNVCKSESVEGLTSVNVIIQKQDKMQTEHVEIQPDDDDEAEIDDMNSMENQTIHVVVQQEE